MEKLRTGRDECACISAVTVEESTPPDKKAPSGTSAIMRFWTASPSRASSAETASSSLPAKGTEVPSARAAASDHQASICGSRSEEHTSELQSLMRTSYAVFCLKKKIPKLET